jgi:glucose-1-phosphate adenylyltransferase
MTERTLAVIMAGGKGERLLPLTGVRAKPAVPFGAVFRIIDFALSNCVNSDIRQILVLTQYKSHSLSRHLSTGFNFLSRRLHKDNGAKLTVSVIRVPAEVARGQYGVLEVSPDGRIIGFEEKPAAPKCIPGTKDCMASMGIYIFENDALHTWLDNDFVDFGKDIIPAMVAKGEPVFAFDFSTQNIIEDYVVVEDAIGREKELGPTADAGYWRDVGTLDSLWKANMDLIAVEPPFSLYGEQWPFFRGPIFFPPAKFVHEEGYRVGKAINSVIADGVIVSGATVRQCVVGPGTVIRSYALVETSVLFGGNIHRSKVLETSIGRNCRVRNAIIDRNVTLLDGVVIGYDRKKDEARGLKTADIAGTDMYVVVVPQDAVLKPE